VHEAGLVTVRRAGQPVMDEVAGGYRPAGDVQPPSFPFPGGLGWLLSGQQAGGLWAVLAVEVYQLLTGLRGWTPRQYDHRLAGVIERLALSPDQPG
jgi:hypothetical protein